VRQDLDRLMQDRGLAGTVVLANDRYSPAFHYVTGQKIHHGVYFRGSDGRAHLIHDPMERDQAALVGCEHSSFAQHGFHRMVEAEAHPARAMGRLIAETCATLGIRGPVALFGEVGLGYANTIVQRTTELNPSLRVDSTWPDLLSVARMTKSEDELEAIRAASRGTLAAFTRLHEHLSSLRRDGEHFRSNGSGPVTLGSLRRLLHAEFVAHGLAEDGESIVSQGRDAGVPHNRGNDAELLRAGAPLMVDIFPGQAGGGYHSDFTRTLCVGEAPEPLKRLHGDVQDAFRGVMDTLKVGAACRTYQEQVCDVFESRGHATLRTNDAAQEGYVHGLGHGVGLAVHEAPRLGGPPSNTQTLQPGMVFSVEPGLYYPSRGLGVRIEDLVAVRADGTFENLTPATYDLEIEPRG
jgi:Xaa-Pro aminopeptidase